MEERKRLNTLKTIAEHLNQSQDRQEMLNHILHKLIEITHFSSGWIFTETNGEMSLASDYRLPPALNRNNKQPMCGQDCYCINRYKAGKLTKATNIIGCHRIEKALKEGRMDTEEITHHATVPLRTPKRQYGLLNVAAPNQSSYKQEELDLLEAIAFQAGSALERMEKFEEEEQRAVILSKLHTFTQHLQQTKSRQEAIQCLLNKLPEVIVFESLVLSERELRGFILEGNLDGGQYIALSRSYPFTKWEKESFGLVLEYLDIVFLQLKVFDQEKEVIKLKERAGLAQDLHDSVSQLLFSAVLTSKASISLASDPALKEQITYIHELTTQALQEMRSLISKHKTEGMDKGLLAGLKDYAKTLDLEITTKTRGTASIPYSIEEILWRIGQEGLHNIAKHAAVKHADILLERNDREVRMAIADKGRGFDVSKCAGFHSYGLSGMKERAWMFGGDLRIISQPGSGTTLEVWIPMRGEGE
ncbi:GAF domain-containing sensor histidine kinase [Sediminibacillus massiliensis]|uniref:GAF domain-containing sensor histidine kinase n=1 Tax=Sediminibacillus massiliensis TaxID=1926277 RepID=UPI0015C39C49|nr:GAF domain-containing sensor histidine kinase [Sediminibacillus massiliensis]